ncbi:hypothetical protein DFQ27_009564 [Actinomortierella ambigua]|uniref:Uncharacterized protein n=1 Tax=Actinomortierella ambigua TaxID=1343610 RepID=A0A9P6TX92_9FUNG|nr:hypothetical protein DFQ27_009564 [Actinomortierella ambigua]
MSAQGSASPPPTKVVLISSATATVQDFYAKFATYLSQELGMIVITYDNRGVGRSMPHAAQQDLATLKAQIDAAGGAAAVAGSAARFNNNMKNNGNNSKAQQKPQKHPLAGFQASLIDWALKDLAGMFRYILANWPETPTLFVGHSVGGHLLPALDPSYTRNVERVLFVAVTSAYWRDMNSPMFMYSLFFLISPVVNRYYGYYPGKTLWGAMEDLPFGCFWDWSHWGSYENYMLGGNPEWTPNYQAFKAPIYSLYFDDDDFSRNSPPKICNLIPNAMSRPVKLYPKDDLKMSVGHMGFFFGACKRKLWETAVRAWLVDGQALDRDQIKAQAAANTGFARM